MAWPENADGDVFRRLESQGFDFSKPCWIDFNVDFESWPPPDSAIKQVNHRFPQATVGVEDDDEGGYLLVRFFEKLTYEFVIRVQQELSESMAPFNGHCDSWGLLH